MKILLYTKTTLTFSIQQSHIWDKDQIGLPHAPM